MVLCWYFVEIGQVVLSWGNPAQTKAAITRISFEVLVTFIHNNID